MGVDPLVEWELAAQGGDEYPLSRLVSDTIRMRREDAVFRGVHFFPPFAEELFDIIDELYGEGFRLSVDEGKTSEGYQVSGRIWAPDGEKLDLGAVLMTGKDVKVVRGLVPIHQLVHFVDRHLDERDEAEPMDED